MKYIYVNKNCKWVIQSVFKRIKEFVEYVYIDTHTNHTRHAKKYYYN